MCPYFKSWSIKLTPGTFATSSSSLIDFFLRTGLFFICKIDLFFSLISGMAFDINLTWQFSRKAKFFCRTIPFIFVKTFVKTILLDFKNISHKFFKTYKYCCRRRSFFENKIMCKFLSYRRANHRCRSSSFMQLPDDKRAYILYTNNNVCFLSRSLSRFLLLAVFLCKHLRHFSYTTSLIQSSFECWWCKGVLRQGVLCERACVYACAVFFYVDMAFFSPISSRKW